jgi:hypothetical protein
MSEPNALSHDYKQILNIKYKKGLSCLNEVDEVREIRDEVVHDGGKAGYGEEQSVAATKPTIADAKIFSHEVKLSMMK